jgi:anaerobic ribonucleoside-triphosphate reductase activating protein
MRILKTFKETYSDGPGIRYSIYVSGCDHKCKGCHNPESWNFDQGEEVNEQVIRRIAEEIKANPLLDGVTISGGDPFYDPKGLSYLLHDISRLKKDIWVYTGFTIEELIAKDDSYIKVCLKYIDTLVDGPYIEELRNTDDFKGSTNQRFIKTKQCL